MRKGPKTNKMFGLGSIQINVNQSITNEAGVWNEMRARYNGRSLSVFSNKLRATLIPRVQRQCQPQHRPHRPALGSRAMDDCICTCAIQEMKPRRGYNTGQAEGRSSDETLQSDALALLSDPPTQTLKTFAATRPFLRIWRVCCGNPM